MSAQTFAFSAPVRSARLDQCHIPSYGSSEMLVYSCIDGYVCVDGFLSFQREPTGRYLEMPISGASSFDRVLDARAFERAQIDRSSCDDGGRYQRSNECTD